MLKCTKENTKGTSKGKKNNTTIELPQDEGHKL